MMGMYLRVLHKDSIIRISCPILFYIDQFSFLMNKRKKKSPLNK